MAGLWPEQRQAGEFEHQRTQVLFQPAKPSSRTLQVTKLVSKPNCQRLWLQWQLRAANVTFTSDAQVSQVCFHPL